jgi:predicted heme/steroid binding protein
MGVATRVVDNSTGVSTRVVRSVVGEQGGPISSTFTAPDGVSISSCWPEQGLPFQGSTWTIQSGRAVNNPTLGSEQNSGTLTVGKIYQITASELDHFYTGSAIGDHFIAAAATGLDANNKVKEVTFSECLTVANGGYTSGRFKATQTAATDRFGGLAIGLDSSTSPTKGLFCYIDRTAAKGELRVLTAANTWTSLISTAVTYSADAELVLVYDGSLGKAWMFYNNTLVGTAQDVSSYTWLQANTIQALFSTGQAANEGFTSCDFGPLNLGSDLFDAGAGTFESGTYGWTVYGTNTIANDAGQLKITYVDNAAGALDYFSAAGDLTTNLTVGALYRIEGYARVNAGSVSLRVATTGGTVTLRDVTQTSLTTCTAYFVADHATTNAIYTTSMGAGEIIWLDNLVLRRVN